MTFSLSIYHGCTLSLQILLEIRRIALAKFYYLILMFFCPRVSARVQELLTLSNKYLFS